MKWLHTEHKLDNETLPPHPTPPPQRINFILEIRHI